MERNKRKLSPEELSLVRSAAGRKGGLKSGYGKGRAPTRTATVRLHDYKVLVAYAGMKKSSIAGMFHLVAKSVVAKYPQLKPPEWID